MLILRNRPLLLLLLGWAVLSVAALFLRPLWPVDETRYVSVAWEMWLRGDFLVPYLNGAPYSQKPPLLFWLMHLGWVLFGVNEWWPRLISPVLAFASAFLTQRLARAVWPDRPEVARHAPWILFGTLLFALFVTLTMFDMLLLVIVLLGMRGLVQAVRGERYGRVSFGVAIGLGLLAKGPVILLHLLPAALLAPWWHPALRSEQRRWYIGVLWAVLLGVVIALLWALPAGYVGGEAYRAAIFWGQMAGRVTESFAHRAPAWHYLPMLPLLLFPWLVWPAFWRGARGVSKDPGARFVLAWLIPVFIGFCLISAKQEKYLLPLVPGFALLAGFALSRVGDAAQRREMLLPALAITLVGAAIFFVTSYPQRFDLPEWVASLPRWTPLAMLGVAGVLMLVGRAALERRIQALAFATLAVVALAYVGVIRPMASYGDTAPVGRYLAGLQASGVPVAIIGKYHAQFNFTGRLSQPVESLNEAAIDAWLAAHPHGRVVMRAPRPHQGNPTPELEQEFLGDWIVVWEADAWRTARRAIPPLTTGADAAP